MTNHKSLVNAETKTKLLGPILLSVVCDENQTGQRRDPSYR